MRWVGLEWLRPPVGARGLPLAYRIYKMCWRSGLIASLPFAALATWYASTAWIDLVRHRRAYGEHVPFDTELFHIALHDTVRHDLDRLRSRERNPGHVLRELTLMLSAKGVDALADAETHQGWIEGRMMSDDGIAQVAVRPRGRRPWHRLGPQKSLKVRVERGELIAGTRAFNLINDPGPLGLESYVALEIARGIGLLAPASEPVRLRVNNADFGILRFETQPDEGLIRRRRRMPGSIYSGDGTAAGSDAAAHVFASIEGWKKVAWRDPDDKDDYVELEELLSAVENASYQDFARWAKASLDLERYAAFDALDVVFGNDEHDWVGNHKLYLDPYTGKLEPIAWALDNFRHEPVFNLVDHPLLIRLKLMPGYLERRNRRVYELLTGAASVAAIQVRLARLRAELAPALAADPYWDAYKLLPHVTRLHRFFLRPMTEDKWRRVAAAELATYAARSRYLLDVLEQPRVHAYWKSAGDRLARLDVVVEGDVSYALRTVELGAPCAGSFTLYADRNGDATFEAGFDPLLHTESFGAILSPAGPHTTLAPGAVLVPRDGERRYGPVRVAAEARSYTYFVRGHACAPESAMLALENLAAGGLLRLEATPRDDVVSAARISLPAPQDVPSFSPGERSPHPWQLESASPRQQVRLGPGTVHVAATRRFAHTEPVRIAAGTRIELGLGATLVFEGPLHAEGTREAPIIVAAADLQRPFGALVLQGPGARGSRLTHVVVSGGRGARLGWLQAPATLNVHATSDVYLESVTLSAGEGEDGLHAAYVEGLVLRDVTVTEAAGDGVDLEFTRAEIRGLRVLGAGDDCLDLMGADVQLATSAVVECINNGVSAGEETALAAHDLFVGRARVGIIAKNASRARVVRLVAFENETMLRANRRELYYRGDSRIEAADVFAVGCERLVHPAPGTTITTTGVRRRWPVDDTLLELRTVLRVTSWPELASGSLAQVVEEGAP